MSDHRDTDPRHGDPGITELKTTDNKNAEQRVSLLSKHINESDNELYASNAKSKTDDQLETSDQNSLDANLNLVKMNQSDHNIVAGMLPRLESHKSTKSRRGSVKLKQNPVVYADLRKFGGAGFDDSDNSEEDNPLYAQKTPNTKRRIKNEETLKNVKKLGPLATYFSLMKAFVATGCLYLPKSFINGGWLFSCISLITSSIMTCYCAWLILECRKIYGTSNFPEFGLKTYGTLGKTAVNIALAFSQIGFTIAYVYFIKENVFQVLNQNVGISWLNKTEICVFEFVIYTLLCWVRKIEIFASFHLFGDIMVVLTLASCVFVGVRYLGDHESEFSDMPKINKQSWTDAIGYSVYAFEGVGVILPIQDVTSDPANYHKLVYLTIFTVMATYCLFGTFCVYTWGNELDTPLITDKLPDNAFGNAIKLLFILNLLVSYPLQLYPANLIVEGYLYQGWQKTKKRQWSKNLTRMLLVLFTILFCVALQDKLDKFLSVLGALTCTPILLFFPPLFHLKSGQATGIKWYLDVFLVVLSVLVLVFCGTLSILAWNDNGEGGNDADDTGNVTKDNLQAKVFNQLISYFQ